MTVQWQVTGLVKAIVAAVGVRLKNAGIAA
jgi:hypothetical protein